METLKSTLTFLLIFCTSFFLDTYVQAQDAGNYPTTHEVKLVEGRKRQLLLLPPAVTNTVVASDLKPGEKYLLIFNKEKGNTTCNPSYRVINGTDSVSFFDNRYDFIAKSKKITIEITPGCEKSYSTRLGMYVSLAITGEHVNLIQQLNKTKGTPEDVVTATSDGDVNFLISDVFIGGGCFDVSGVSPIGSAIGMGTFDGGGSSIQIESGVIITCGNATIANGPNDGEGSGASNGGGTDADLVAMGGASIFDATGIQFDFKPTINLVQFNYVFGSDEYEEYTCSQFNDVFGFFIDGPSLNKNIALIPSTTLPVKINNVNQGSPGAFGTVANCTPPAGSLAYSGFYISNPVGSSDVEYDGFTTVFTAESAVFPCSTYHIKLIIGDAGDAIFDSGVFLEANSFSAGGNASGEVVVPSTGTNVIYEGCTDGFIHFERQSSIGLDEDLVITFIIDPSSTATSGVDYESLPTSITIPAGETEYDLPINVFKDLITEGTETIKIKLSTPCSCETPFILINIKDPIPITIMADDITVCEEDGGGDICASASGGVGTFTYLWSNGGDEPCVFVFTNTTQTYTVTVTDECGTTATKSVKVTVIKSPIATISGYGKVCAGQSGNVDLTITFTGGAGPWTLVYAIDGIPQTALNITSSPYTLKATEAGIYTVYAVYGQFDCPGIGEGEALIEEVKVEMFDEFQDPSCFALCDGEIHVDPFGGEGDYYIQWSNGVESFDYIDQLCAGTYKVTVTDEMGCKAFKTWNLVKPSEIKVTAVVENVKDCFDQNGGSIDQTITGGVGPYFYEWDNGLAPEEDQPGLASGLYTVTITDLNGCELVKSYSITAINGPTSSAVTLKNVNCAQPNSGSINVTVTGGTTPYQFQWSPNANGANTEDVSGLPFGNYSVTITDAGGCNTYASAVITADTLKPIVLTGPDKVLSCAVTSLKLDASNTPLPNGFKIEWSTVGGNIVSGATTLTPTVDQPGVYVLTVTNPVNGCTNSGDVVVDPDQNKPQAFIPPAGILTCAVTQLTLDGTSSSTGTKYVTNWVAQNGGTIVSPTTGVYTVDITSPGTYLLTITDTLNGCSTTTSVVVTQDIAIPAAEAGNSVTLTCKDTQLDLNGTGTSVGSEFKYDWNTTNGFIVTGKTSLTPKINAPGTYQILVTNTQNGCINLDSVVVNQNIVPPLAAAAAPSLLTCTVSTVPVNATGSSTGSSFTYNWSTSNGSISGPNTGFTINATQIGTYTVIVTDNNNGCTEIATAIVGEDKELPVAVAGPDLLKTCAEATKTLDGAGSSVGANFTYQWTAINGKILSGDKTLNPVVEEAGQYKLVVTNTTNGCTAEDITEVLPDENAPVIVFTTPEIITCNKLAVLINGSGSSAGSIFDYSWTTTNGNIVSGANTATPTVNKAGTYTLVINNMVNGCTTSKSINVIENKVAPKAVAGPDFEAGCFQKPVQLDGSKSSGTGNLTYNWTTTNGEIQFGAATSAPGIIKPGTYSLLVTDESNGCTAEDVITVTSNALAAAEVTLQIPSCFGEFGTAQVTDVIGGIPPYLYSINGGQSYTGNTVFNKLEPGVYTIFVKDGYDCIVTNKFEIPAKTDMKVVIEPKVNILLGETYKLKAQVNIPKSQIKKVEWFSKEGLSRPDSLVTITNVLQTTEYTVKVTDLSGCTASAKVLVVVEEPEIFVPNVFSPHNLDGNNDVLMVFGRTGGSKQINKFEVFDRWGEKMYDAQNFQPNDPNFGWNGLSRGKKVNPAVFVWWCEVELINGKKKIYKGDASLLR